MTVRFSLPRFLLVITGTLLSLALLNEVTAQQQVYKIVDENGKVTYTDDPGDKPAEKVDIPKANVVPPVTPRPRSQRPPENSNVPSQYEVKIVAPAHEAQLNPGDRDVTIGVATEPSLHPKHHIQISDNGQINRANGSSLTITNIIRGAHTISAQVINEKGQVIGTSNSITIYVHRPSVAR